jgi:DNA-directed RNA polymerase subunit RPC12/RpoP
MKLKYTTSNGKISVEFDGDSQKDLFGQIASFQEVFEESKCGKCGSENLRFIVRTVDENDYYELRCMDCGAKLAFGVNKKGGGLFPKRKDGDTWLPNGGWVKWNNKTQQNE